MEKKCNCKEPYDAELFQGGYPYCPIHDNKPEPPATPEWELINRIVSQWGNAVEMPNMEQWLKDYAAKTQPGAVWVKGAKGFPVMKRVVAKFKHYDDPLRDWVAGFASSSTGETITFDWGVSSITLDINHERWDMLYWLDESAAGIITYNPRYELCLALRDMIKLVKRIYGDDAIPVEYQKRIEAADGMLNKHFKVTDVLRGESAAGREEDAKPVGGLKFRSRVAPLNLYEVVELFEQSNEFKVKVTQECEVDRAISYEVWSIDGFEKYYRMGVYFKQQKEK